jgi:hypothetical protein
MCRIGVFVFLGIFMFSPVVTEGQELPSSLTCRSNVKASRDYAFAEGRWEGQKDQSALGPASLLNVETRDSKLAGMFYSLRDKVFSGLHTSAPLVRSITRFSDGTDRGEEFASRVVMRTSNTVFLLWTNDMNKTWVAAVDLAHRKAAVAQVFEGVTSLGGELETLDCQ